MDIYTRMLDADAVCREQSNDGQTYARVGKLNGWPVKVLQDTCSTGMIVG